MGGLLAIDEKAQKDGIRYRDPYHGKEIHIVNDYRQVSVRGS